MASTTRDRLSGLHLQNFMKTAHTPSFLIYMGGYAALLAWFKLADVYHTHFATKGLIVVVYNAFCLCAVPANMTARKTFRQRSR
jgi:hypothetical protein